MPDQSLCARCAELGRTCCQGTQIFLTLGDLERIAPAMPGECFWERAVPVEDNYRPDFEYDAVWSRIFGPDGGRRVLRHRSGGDCHFLTAAGCRLPARIRPLVCRLYPFDYNHTAIKGVYGHLCPEAGNGPLLLAMLGMNRDEAEEWRRQLYQEICREFPDAGPSA